MTPIFRIEYFLDEIVNNNPCPYDPVFRYEYYLAKIAGHDVECPTPIVRREKYLAKLAGMDVEIPSPLFREEYYLAKLCGEDVEVPTPMFRIEYWLYDWAGGGELDWQTFTGNPLQFNAPKAHTLKSAKAEFSPIQSGSGDPSPDNIRPISGWTGANVWDEHDYDPTSAPKLTVTWTSEGTVYGGYVIIYEDGSVDLYTLVKKRTVGNSGWNYYAPYMYHKQTDKVAPALLSADYPLTCSMLPYGGCDYAYNFPDMSVCQASNQNIYIKDTSCTSAAEYYAKYKDAEITYWLADPVVTHLDSVTQLQSLVGINTVWTDGDRLTVEARANAVQLNALQSLNMLLGGRYYNNGGADEPSDEEALDILLGGHER